MRFVMNRWAIVLAIGFFGFSNFDMPALGFAELVHNRYYCINRAKKAVSFLITAAKRTDYSWVDLFIDDQKIAYFSNPIVIKSLKVLVEDHHMDSIVDLWDKFKGYHHIVDVTFLDETMRAIALIAMALAMDTANKVIIRAQGEPQFFDSASFEKIPLHQLFSMIKQCCNYISHAHDPETCIHPGVLDQKNTDWIGYGVLLHIDTIAERFYYIKRLAKSITVLCSAYDYHKHLSKDFSLVFTDNIANIHPRIASCVHKMQGQGPLAPLLAAWESLKEYEYIQDRLFVHDFSRLLFLYYRNLYLHYVQNRTKITSDQQSLLEKIADVYQKIEKLPIEEIISVIDVLMNDLPVLMQQCDLQSSLSWNEWFKKYWWAPTLLSMNVFMRVIKKMFGKHLFNSITPHSSTVPSGNSMPFFSLE